MTSTSFLSAFGLYIGFMIWLGWFVSRHQKTGEDFLLGGRSLSVFLTLGTTVATMVGTGSSMGAVGFGYTNGWAGMLYGLGGAVGILLAGWWFAPMRQLRFMTMSEELSYYVGASMAVKNLVGFLILIASIGWLGAHILGGSLYLSWGTGLSLGQAKLLIAVAFGIYVVIGGYTAVVWTDTLQAVVLFAGFIWMAFAAVSYVGGWEAVRASVDADALSFLAVDRLGVVPALSLAAVVAVGVLATPSYRQRIYSGKNVSSVRRSFYLSGVLYLFFAALPAVIGMAAYAIDPGLENSNFAFPFAASTVLQSGPALVVLIAGLSATMSSASSDAIAGVSILVRDVYTALTGSMPAASAIIRLSRLSLVLVIGLALLLALTSNDIISYITKMIATVLSGLFVCSVLGRFWRRYTWQGAIASLIGASAASALVLMVPAWLSYWGNPCIPSVAVSSVAGITVSLLTPASRRTCEEALAIITEQRESTAAMGRSTPGVPRTLV